MYESFFGLRKRPFAAAPDAEILVETPAVADAIERLDRCIQQGRGIAVLTAAAGMGKTHLCHRLVRQWGAEYQAVVLPNGGFPTRRGLLQSVLAELGQPYQRLGETELRLELTAAAREARKNSAGVILLFDEAHRHSERVLEEIRLIANLFESGQPLVRIVLAGQLELEERLADPALSGLNERVGEVVTLPRLTADESRDYLRQRAVTAGGSLDGLFDAAATSIVVQACGGVPRCLNQLADHGLLLGYVAERRPVDESLVREALDDLKRLPLHWHDPMPLVGSAASSEPARPQEAAPAFEDMIEIGSLDDERDSGSGTNAWTGREVEEERRPEPATIEFGADPAGSVDLPQFRGTAELRTALPGCGTETIRDRFARLDAADAQRRWAELMVQFDTAGTATRMQAVAAEPRRKAEAKPIPDPLELLDRIEPLIAEALAGESAAVLVTQAPSATRETERVGIAQPVCEEAGPTRAERTAVATRPAVRPHRHSTLFSDLRRRQRQREQ